MNIVKADAEGFIWLIVAVFWVIAQIAGAAAKKKMPTRTGPEDETQSGPEEPFAELLKTLSGVKEFKIPEPEPSPVEPLRREPEWNPCDLEHTSEIHPLEPVLDIKPPAPPEPIHQVDIRPTMSAFRNTLPAMKLPSMNLHVPCAVYHDRDTDSGKKISLADRLDLKDPKTLRRAMLTHFILSKPKVLE
jgi:hypothetical protein